MVEEAMQSLVHALGHVALADTFSRVFPNLELVDCWPSATGAKLMS